MKKTNPNFDHKLFENPPAVNPQKLPKSRICREFWVTPNPASHVLKERKREKHKFIPLNSKIFT